MEKKSKEKAIVSHGMALCGISVTTFLQINKCNQCLIITLQEERRVVYVGRIRGTMTQKELKERFSLFGEIEDCTLHFRDHG